MSGTQTGTLLGPLAADGRERIVACRVGRVAYGPAWNLQRRIQNRLVAAKRDRAPACPHVLLTVEHPPVVTMGKSGDEGSLLRGKQALADQGVEYFAIDRGGDATYHGPGQLVAYPLLDLDRFFTDIHRYLRELEEVVIGVCGEYGLEAGRVADRTGVWIGPDERGPERKVCAMGIRCSRWVTMHGLALNVATDLAGFDAIIPCGITDRGVTSLARELGREPTIDDVEARLVRWIGERFDAHVDHVAGPEAIAFLESLLEGAVELDPAVSDHGTT